MPFTEEELMQLQEEVEREAGASPDGSEEDSKEVVQDGAKEKDGEDKAEKGKEVKEEGGEKEKEVKKDGDKIKSEEGKEKEKLDDEDGEKGKKEVIEEDEEVRELRELTKAQKIQLERIKREYERVNKLLKEKGLIDEDDEKAREEAENTARAAYDQRLGILNDMLEVMKVNPKYEDIEEVVSQRNFDDMITAMAKFHVSRNGGDLSDVMTEVEREVWSLPNPYKYMYDMVKKFHPAYVQPKEKTSIIKEVQEALGQKSLDGGDKGKEKEKDVKIKDQAPSLQDLPGAGGKDGGGWTSARIDAMPEEDLHLVPRDTYEKYLAGTLQ